MKSTSNLFFETLSTKLRWKILSALKEKSRTVGEICKLVDEDQSKVSHNLKKLRECHFIEVKKMGKERIYSLNKKTILPLLKLVEKHVQDCCVCNVRCVG